MMISQINAFNQSNYSCSTHFNLPLHWTDSDPNISELKSGKITTVGEFTFEELEAATDVPFNEILPGLYLGNRYGAGKILGKAKSRKARIHNILI